ATAYPLAYFLICFCTAFARHRSKALAAVGIVIHAFWALIVITMGIIGVFEGAALFGMVGLFFAAPWLVMYANIPAAPPKESLQATAATADSSGG
ncbi:MAG TPA: hypothetical protein VN673_15575, partial [Clostridia bacterium]|nr:hypothetical protein [Clostridia bacterium]